MRFARELERGGRSTNEAMRNTPRDVRLQLLIAGWQGGQRGEPLTVLHTQCVKSAGHESPLLPTQAYFVENMDAATLRENEKLNHTYAHVRFQIYPAGQFDAALVPTGKLHCPLDCFGFATGAAHACDTYSSPGVSA